MLFYQSHRNAFFVSFTSFSSSCAVNAHYRSGIWKFIYSLQRLHNKNFVNIVYDGLFYNYGNAYNPHSGASTAPSVGLYIFTWTSTFAPKKLFYVEILVNGHRNGLGNYDNELH